jgi:hypothetical protein
MDGRVRFPAWNVSRSAHGVVWADTLLAIERAHLLRVLVWGTLSAATGIAILAMVWRRRAVPALLRRFGAQTLLWGAVELSLGALALWTLGPRDLARATKLVDLLRLEAGLTAGAAVIGVTLALAGWRTGRRQGMMGAGMAIALQGAALFLLHWRTLQTISRWM